ncbi:MAG: hypothetical protein ACUVTL_00330 [Thermoproteota archaeon]
MFQELNYHHLSHLWRKDFRNGNWRKLNRVEKALYMASLYLVKMRGKIVNSRLVLELQNIIGKLMETVGKRLVRSAYQRATELYQRYVSIGLFRWAPHVRSWFKDPKFFGGGFVQLQQGGESY